MYHHNNFININYVSSIINAVLRAVNWWWAACAVQVRCVVDDHRRLSYPFYFGWYTDKYNIIYHTILSSWWWWVQRSLILQYIHTCLFHLLFFFSLFRQLFACCLLCEEIINCYSFWFCFLLFMLLLDPFLFSSSHLTMLALPTYCVSFPSWKIK